MQTVTSTTRPPLTLSDAVRMPTDQLKQLPPDQLARIGSLARMHLSSDLPLPQGITTEQVASLAVMAESLTVGRSPDLGLSFTRGPVHQDNLD